MECPWTGKSGWRDPGVASFAAKRVSEAEGVVLRPYVCPACLHYHLTRNIRRDDGTAPAVVVLRGVAA